MVSQLGKPLHYASGIARTLNTNLNIKVPDTSDNALRKGQ